MQRGQGELASPIKVECVRSLMYGSVVAVLTLQPLG